MSVSFVSLNCTRCDESWASSVVWGNYNYQLDSGLIIPLKRTLGYCRDCDTMSPVEDELPSLNTCEVRKLLAMATLEDLKPEGKWQELLHYFNRRKKREIVEIVQELKLLEKKIDWLRERKSPNRCLECGSVNIEHIRDYHTSSKVPVETEYIHPGCGGRIMKHHSGVRIHMRLRKRIYDREGLLMRIVDDSFPDGRN